MFGFLFIYKAKIKVFAFLVGTKNVEWDFKMLSVEC
nr:MAG TPA_asm: hypothetical protein [Caudoviricetes sp.]